MTGMAGVSSGATLFSFLCNWKPDEVCWIWLLLIALGILGGCFLYAWWMSRSKKSVNIEINSTFILTIKEGNLFDSQLGEVTVIPVNTCFNPHSVERKSSVFYQFVHTYWEGENRRRELDGKIQAALSKVNEKLIGKVASQEGYDNEYPLGTCIMIEDGGKKYVLVATARKVSAKGSDLALNEYPMILEELFQFLAKQRYQKTIYLPLIGMGHGQLKKSCRRSLYFLLDVIEFKQSDLSFPNGICLKLKSLRNAGINLTEVENDFKLNIKG